MANSETSMTKAQVEQYVLEIIENRFQSTMEEYVLKNDYRAKELSVIERVIRVEDELKMLREMSDHRFEAQLRETTLLREAMEKRFEAVDKRFEAMDKRFEAMDKRFEVVDKRFEAVDKRFEAVDKRFEALQHEMKTGFDAMDKRFEAVDKHFSMLQWMIGLFVGLPALIIAAIQLINALK